MFANRSCKKKGGGNAYLRMERSPGFKQQRRLRFASPLGPLFNAFFPPPRCQPLRGWALPSQHPLGWKCHRVVYATLGSFILLGGEKQAVLPAPRGRRPYPASAEGKVPCKGSKLFFTRAAPNRSSTTTQSYFLAPPGPTFQENGRIFRTFWWMICTRHGPRWNCLLCFVWGGGELI